MSIVTTASAPTTEGGLRSFVRQHPVLSYFILAYVGTWLLFVPILLSSGLHVIDLPDAAGQIFFILSTISGPLGAAFLLTGVIEGRAGVGRLARRMVQWRVGVFNTLLVLLGYPLVLLIGMLSAGGTGLLAAIPANWAMIFSLYLPGILIGMFVPGVGEETGWRGFALPRLQRQYGPLPGSLILGGVHAVWHLPAYFVPGAILQGGFDPLVFVTNSLAIIALTCVWTWLFNRAQGSILFAMFTHATSNSSTGFMASLLGFTAFSAWHGPLWFGVVALLVILGTRGRLAYDPDHAPDSPATP